MSETGASIVDTLLIVNQNGTRREIRTRTLRAGADGNFDTLKEAAALVIEDAAFDSDIRQRAAALVAGCNRDPGCQVRKLFEFAQGIVHIDDPVGLERISDAATTVAEGFGDCADKAILLATMLGALGFVSRFVLLSFDDDDIQRHGFDHVFLETLLPDGRWITLDPDAMYHGAGYEPHGTGRTTYAIWDLPEGELIGVPFQANEYRETEGLGGFLDDLLPGLIQQGTQAGLQYAGQRIQQSQASGAQEKQIGHQFDLLDDQVFDFGLQLNDRGNAITAGEVQQFATAIGELEQFANQYSGVEYVARRWSEMLPTYQRWVSGLAAKLQPSSGGNGGGTQQLPGENVLTPGGSGFNLDSITGSPLFWPGLILISALALRPRS